MISIHVVVDTTTNEELDMALWYVTSLQSLFPDYQLVINVAAGSQIDRGMQFVERVRQALPNIIIIWRVLEDTGIHAMMSPEAWYAMRVAPRVAWMQKNRVVMLLDNESSGDDNQIKYYVWWEIEALKLLHTVGLNGAVARFATGNIDDGSKGSNQYPLLKPLFDALKPGDWVSPNEYTNLPGKSSAGNLERWKRMETVAGKKLPITIGEAGLLDDYRARDGWVGKTTAQAYVAAVLDDEQWYRSDIVRCLFCIGGYQEWDTLQVNRDILQLLLNHYKEVKPVPTPIEEHFFKNMSVTTPVNFRATPDIKGTVLKKLDVGVYVVDAIGVPVAGGSYNWQKITLDNQTGYVAKEVVSFSDIYNIPPTDPVVTGNVQINKLTLDDAKTLLTEIIEDAESLAAKARAILIKLQTAS